MIQAVYKVKVYVKSPKIKGDVGGLYVLNGKRKTMNDIRDDVRRQLEPLLEKSEGKDKMKGATITVKVEKLESQFIMHDEPAKKEEKTDAEKDHA